MPKTGQIKTSKKILILITKAEIGGAQNFALNLAQGLKSAGWTVVIGCGQSGYLAEQAKLEKIDFVVFQGLKRSHNPLSALRFIWRLRRYLAQQQFRALILNSSNTLPASWAAARVRPKPKTIFVFHGLSLLDKNYRRPAILKFFYRLYFKAFLPFVDENVFVSQKNLNAALAAKIAKQGKVIYTGRPGINRQILPAQAAINFLQNKANRQLSGKFILGSIGRLAYPKNYEFLINNFAAVKKIKPNACLVIIGAGPEKEKYQKLIKKTGQQNNIFLLGGIKNAWRYLRAFDLFVLPSEFEGLSLTLIEALTAGRPILASAVGGNAEIVGDDKNQLYQPQNIKNFLEKFNRLANNELSRRQAMEKNLAQAQKFSWRQMISQYINLITSQGREKSKQNV